MQSWQASCVAVTLRFVRLSSAALLLHGATLKAQTRPDGSTTQESARVALRDYSERRFASPDGLRSLAVFAVEALSDGSLWIGTEAGPHRFTGTRFERVEIPGSSTHVRSIARASNGSIWFGTRTGVVRRLPDGSMREFDTSDGLTAGTVYSLAVSNAYDGTERVVAATSEGIAVYMGSGRWASIPLPPNVEAAGLVVRARKRVTGRDELWLATSSGTAARWRDGQWDGVYGAAQGLRVRSVEQFGMASDSARTLYAGTSEGVFVFDESTSTGRWSLVRGSPLYSYRVATVPHADGSHDLWVGTLDGLLMRKRGATWDTVQLRSTEPRTPVHALTAVRGHAGGFAVYVGTFGDGMVRLSVGRAATLVSEQTGLRLSITSVLEEPLGQPGVTWIGTSNFGVVEVAAGRARTIATYDDVVDGRVVTVFTRGSGAAAEVWVGAVLGAWRREGGRWMRRDVGIGSMSVTRFASERTAEDSSPLLAATAVGLRRWDGERWNPVEGAPQGAATYVLGESPTDSSVWIAGGFGTAVRRAGTWLVDSSLLRREEPAIVRALCRLATSEGDRILAASNRGVFFRDRSDAAWRDLPARIHDFFRSDVINAIRCDDASRVLVATNDGVAVLDLSDRDTSAWHMVTMFGPADGLPSPVMQAIGEGGGPGERWIGTAHGVGRIDVRDLPEPDPSVFRMRIVSGNDAQLVSDGTRVDFEDNRVAIDLTLPTYHREEDLQYRIEVDGPLSVTPSEWTSESRVSYPALPPGNYSVQAWARDYAGREYGPVAQRFTVGYPPWRSPLVLLAYAVAAAALLFAAHRWRLRTIQARATELAASEQRLRASERQFRALFDRAFDANLLVRNRSVVAANAAAVALLGGDDGLTGVTIDALALPRALAERRGSPADAVEINVSRVDGTRVPAAATVTTIEREDGPMQHWVLRDLSAAHAARNERQLLESQVREAQKLESLGTLAGGVAHDFNNLLGVIRGNAELARESLDDRDEVAGHLSAVLDASERARDLVRQILTFSRRNQPHERIIDFGAVVRTLVPMLRSLIPRTVDLDVIGGDAVYAIRGDLTQLQQLLFNLCSNAEYAMRPTNGGRLEIRLDVLPAPDDIVSETARVVRLRVSDSGVGMAPEVRDRVFEPFFTTKPTGEGTGLGLSVLHGIVASHGGRVRVDSELGVGTTFDVLMPLVAESSMAGSTMSSSTPISGMPAVRVAAAVGAIAMAPAVDERVIGARATGEHERGAPASLSPAEAAATLKNARVVLVDDEPAVARVVERALSRLGCRVRTFHDPREALEAVRLSPDGVDVLVTDQTMPGMTGDVLAQAVHKVRPGLPVVIVTGYSYRLTPERLAEVGAAAILQKPVPLAVLEAAVASVLHAARTDEATRAS